MVAMILKTFCAQNRITVTKSFKMVLAISAILSNVSCSDDITIGDLGEGVMQELIDILTGVSKLTGQCGPPHYIDINFLLYTRSNPNNSITLDPYNATQVDPNKKVIILIHGWLSGPTVYGVPEIKDAALKRYDCNFIIVDWSKLAFQLYTTSYCELPGIGALVGKFLCNLRKQLNIPLSSVHVMGNSIGAHLAGYTGQYTKVMCEPIGRITGLDPAGPLYQGLPNSDTLDKSDATFVDIIHTNELVFGIWGNYGHVDFHVNCGTVQNGCPDFDFSSVENALLSVVSCFHLRSMTLYAESLNSDDLIARSCSHCPRICTSDMVNASFIIMGEDCPTNPPRSVYWIPTNGSPPYGKGCAPYSSGCSRIN